MKSEGVVKVISIHPEGPMNAWTKCNKKSTKKLVKINRAISLHYNLMVASEGKNGGATKSVGFILQGPWMSAKLEHNHDIKKDKHGLRLLNTL